MKTRISVTLSEDLLKAVDQFGERQRTTRSNLIEAALLAFIKRLAQEEQNTRDLETINRRANCLKRKERA